MACAINNQRLILRKTLPVVVRRFVSTSNKKCETATVDALKSGSQTKVEKSWVSYGFAFKNKELDRNGVHSVMFASVSLCLVGGGFYWMYCPDFNLKDWSQRQAYLELHRREANGLPLIDPNFIDPAKIELPSDEELGDTEIIV